MSKRKKRNTRIFVGDFETTVYEGQERTDVWVSAIVEIGSEDVTILGSIYETYKYLIDIGENVRIYYHNLKFDGTFWLDFLIHEMGFTTAMENGSMVKPYRIKSKELVYSISDMGVWYNIHFKVGSQLIEIRDSLKLLPFSVKRLGSQFGTKHHKLDMDYEGYRYPNCPISDDEKKYIANDVLVVKEALEIMFSEGHNKLTIGSCCFAEFKKISFEDNFEYDKIMPDLTAMKLDKNIYGAEDVDEYIRNSYRGGWCYVVKGKENKVYHKGITCDVNSLYPSVMSGESGNRYPVGEPTFWRGNYIPEDALKTNKYYFVRFRTKFKIKKNMLPFIQVKHNALYRSTEMLETSQFVNHKTGEVYDRFVLNDGSVVDSFVTLTLSQTDYDLFLEHYDTFGLEILDGCYFNAIEHIFDTYINKYRELKINAKDKCHRQIAKLFLNSLYGKTASSKISSFKVAFDDDGIINYDTIREENKKAGYIAIGSAITSYARNFTIRTAQKNYSGPDKPGFIYADTDSIHCDLEPEELVDVPVHPSQFLHWKIESSWDYGKFIRQKTYVEHIVKEDLESVEKPYYNIKCAGLPNRCKDLFLASVGEIPKPKHLTKGGEEFVSVKRTIDDFKLGIKIPEKLLPKRIKGGTVLVNSTYEMR